MLCILSAVFQLLRALLYVLCAFVMLSKDYLLTYLPVSGCLPVNGAASRLWTSLDDCSCVDGDTTSYCVDAFSWQSDVGDFLRFLPNNLKTVQLLRRNKWTKLQLCILLWHPLHDGLHDSMYNLLLRNKSTTSERADGEVPEQDAYCSQVLNRAGFSWWEAWAKLNCGPLCGRLKCRSITSK